MEKTSPRRLQLAKQFGAIPISSGEAKSKITELSSGIGADAVMDAVGSGPASRLAYELVRPGGIISVVGVCNDAHLSFSPVEAYNKNITYKVGRCPSRFYMEKLIPVVQEKKFVFLASCPSIQHRCGIRIASANFFPKTAHSPYQKLSMPINLCEACSFINSFFTFLCINQEASPVLLLPPKLKISAPNNL